MSDPSNREVAVFNAALELSSAERAAYLDAACAGDAPFRQRIERLLEGAEVAGDFLESPATGVPDAPLQELPRDRGEARHPAEAVGDRIGRYKLLQAIGEGGCGVVYMAEQQEPVRRLVALKIIKLGMDTKQVISRFEAERQALALMDHANIAKVLDAGATETGRPYFVMELVRGIKITDYCDQKRLPTRQRLALFVQVCQAIQHAHQKGVIHRDIKPSNILVTQDDGVPLPKVIDFGIAKATGQLRLTDHTLFTAFEQFLGTPAYMSPEQAELSASGVDTRTDIYSLGVLLYELLTGTTPFDTQALMRAGLDEVRRAIREQEPVRPSTRLSTMLAGDLTATAQCRQAEPPRLISLVRGDLDWIVMKALEKERGRRYETANGLAKDVERYLTDEPVVARPPSRLYRFQKLVRRNKLVFAGGLGLLGALLVASMVSTGLLLKERVANRRATAAEKRSRVEAGKSAQVAQFLQDMLEGVGPDVALGGDTRLLRKILERTEQRVEMELGNQPEVAAEVLRIIARVYDELGDFAEAETLFQQSLNLFRAALGEEHEHIALVLDQLGAARRDRGDWAGAETNLVAALAMQRKLLPPATPALAATLQDLGEVRLQHGDLPGAEAVLREALAIASQPPHAAKGKTGPILNDLGFLLWQRGDLQGAEKAYRAALDVYKKTLDKEGPPIVIALGNLGLVQWEQGELAEAEATLAQVLARKEKLLGPEHLEVANTLHNFSLVLRDEGRLDAAAEAERRALTIVTRKSGENSPYSTGVRKALAVILRRQGDIKSDPELLREALRLNPADAATADALSGLLAGSSLTPLTPALPGAPVAWRFTNDRPAPNWSALDFSDSGWNSAGSVSGFPTLLQRSEKTDTPNTNLWLRQEFDLTDLPTGTLAFRLNRNHDAEIYLNGIPAAPAANWTDARAVLDCSEAGKAALRRGRNVLGIHCSDADGGSPIGVEICLAPAPNLGLQRLLEEFVQLTTNQSPRPDVYAGWGSALARLGRFGDAASALAKAIELKPSLDTELALYWFQLAPLLLQTGDLTAYRHQRQAALARFANSSNALVAQQVSRLALLAPADGADLERAAKLADVAAAAQYPDAGLACRQLAKGLAEYRLARFNGAADWLRQAVTNSSRVSQPGWNAERQRNRLAAACFVEAMVRQRLGQPDRARAALAQGCDIVQAEFPAGETGDLGRDWHESLMARLLMQEARTVCQSP